MDTQTARETEPDRRASQRLPLRLPLRYQTEERQSLWQSELTRNISEAGILFPTEKPLGVASRVQLMLSVPGEAKPHQISSLVMRTGLDESGRHVIGVKFLNLSDTDRAKLARALQRSDIMALLSKAVELGASDLHLSANHPPLARVAGQLQPLSPEPIDGPYVKQMIYSLMDERQRQTFERDLELNFSVSVSSGVRFRINVLSQRGFVEAAIRRIESTVRTIAELNLPEILLQIAQLREGLVLITGPSGAGKTTTVAAMLDDINGREAAIIITLEQPIEYVHAYKRSVVRQREIGTDTHSYPIALREALRQDPDVIVVGEVRDDETMKTALDAAETGHLVIATLPAADSVRSILRVTHFFHKEREQEIRLQLSNALRAVVSQRLLPRADGRGMIPATEVLINTPAVANLIRNGSTEQIASVIQTGMTYGMHTLASSLHDLHKRGLIGDDVLHQQLTGQPVVLQAV